MRCIEGKIKTFAVIESTVVVDHIHYYVACAFWRKYNTPTNKDWNC